MDAFQQFQNDLREGRIDSPQIISFVAITLRQLQETQGQLQETQSQLQETQQQLKTANNRIDQLEKKTGARPTTKLDEPYSMTAEERRRKAKDPKEPKTSKGGRRKNQDKMGLVARTEQVYPEGVPRERCKLAHTRQVWQIEQGQAVLVAYEVYRGPNKQYGKVPGVLGRGGYGWPILIALGYMVYIKGLSLDLACDLLGFFKELPLKKSQAEALMRQLAKHWERQFETLCELLANSAVVHADETSWSIKSVWAFLSEQSRVLLYGVNKTADTLKKILDAEVFKGILISDDAAVYSGFSLMQKCWAHLIRKAIKLTLQSDDPRYRRLADGLIEIYRAARVIQTDPSLDDAAKLAKVELLVNQLGDLCYEVHLPETSKGLEHDYVLLCHEVMRLCDIQLFTFVTAPPTTQPNGKTAPVGGTNNEAERTLRNPASARKTGRTSKTDSGTRRRTILTSVLESLRVYLPVYTLRAVVDETLSWLAKGFSCFEERLQRLGLKLPEKPVLDQLYPTPQPSG